MHVTVRHVTVQRVEQRLCFLHGLVVFGVRVGFDGDAAARARIPPEYESIFIHHYKRWVVGPSRAEISFNYLF